MNAALLRDGAERPDGFWLRLAARRAAGRLKIFAAVALLPAFGFGALYWTGELGKEAAAGSVFGAAAATAAILAAAVVLVGALLDVVCETSRFGALLQREYQFYFHTPVPYMVLVLFTLASGWFFSAILLQSGMVTARFAFQSIASFLIFLIPILTIRTFAEEKASGTVEPLLTAPVSEAHVVAGKFFGALTFLVVMLAPTTAYLAVLRFIGQDIGKPDTGPIVAAYAGMILFGGFHIAIGIFASTLTQDSILGAFLGFVVTLLFWVVEPLMQAKQLLATPGWNDAARYLSPVSHLEPFLKGVLAPLDTVYFVSFTLFFLFLAVRFIEYRKWR